VWLQVDAVTAPRVGFWRRAVAVLEEHGRLRADGDLARFVAGDVPVEAVPGLVVELLYQYNGAVRVVVDDIHLLAPEAVRDIIWVLERAPQRTSPCSPPSGVIARSPRNGWTACSRKVPCTRGSSI
jgi:hypothetical protein